MSNLKILVKPTRIKPCQKGDSECRHFRRGSTLNHFPSQVCNVLYNEIVSRNAAVDSGIKQHLNFIKDEIQNSTLILCIWDLLRRRHLNRIQNHYDPINSRIHFLITTVELF